MSDIWLGLPDIWLELHAIWPALHEWGGRDYEKGPFLTLPLARFDNWIFRCLSGIQGQSPGIEQSMKVQRHQQSHKKQIIDKLLALKTTFV